MFRVLLFGLFFSLCLCSCSEPEYNQTERKVHIRKKEGIFTLYKNNRPFEIKGASGFSNFRLLKESGGNAMRVWDTTNIGVILDSARANNISVIVGLPVQNSSITSFYNDSAKIASQHYAFKKIIIRYKDDPALLMWCIGNELDFPFNLSYNNFYRAFNNLTDMIHQQDPDHPVTTTILNFNKKYILNLLLRCRIDLISFNIFNQIETLRTDLNKFSWIWRGPFLLLEWGVDGPWKGTEQTAWSAFIEPPSKKKADLFIRRFQRYMPVENSRYLGCFMFFWGYKQETTQTWFSFFDKSGAKSEPVNSLKYLWTGKSFREPFPMLNYMLVNNLGARNNIILKPGENLNAKLVFLPDTTPVKRISWQIFREDWFKINDMNNTQFLMPLDSLAGTGESLEAVMKVPEEEGPYRIFATVYNKYGNFATANTPFYVLRTK